MNIIYVLLCFIGGLFVALVFVLTLKSRVKKTNSGTKEITNNLYYSRMGGVGSIMCLDCGFSEDIIAFTHGVNSSYSGLQCQSCGSFKNVHNWKETNKQTLCDCGGKLNRDKAIFCTKCKSLNMKYNLKYIT